MDIALKPSVVGAEKFADQRGVGRQLAEHTARVTLAFADEGGGDAQHERVIDEAQVFEPVGNQVEGLEQVVQGAGGASLRGGRRIALLQQPGELLRVFSQRPEPTRECFQVARI